MPQSNFEKWIYYTKDIESPYQYLEWGWIHLIASTLQRRVWMYSNKLTGLPDHNSLFCNIFQIPIGPPSTGKGRVIKQVAGFLRHPMLSVPSPSGKLEPLITTSPDKTSPEQLVDVVAKATRPMEYFVEIDGQRVKRTVGHCSCSFLIEELEVLFSRNSQDTVSILNQCYDSGDLDYQLKTKASSFARNVCVNIIAGTYPDAIKNLLSDKVIKAGFVSRVIMIYADAPRFRRIFPGIGPEQQIAADEILAHIKYLATKVVGEVTLSDSAYDYVKQVYESGDLQERLRVNRDPRLDNYYGRKRIHWLKLGIIRHFSEPTNDYVVTKEEMEWALDLLNRTEVRMHEAFATSGRNELHDLAKQVARYLQEKGELRYKSLWFRFSNDLRRVEFDECLEYLLGTNQIINTTRETSMLDRGVFQIAKKNGEINL